jgi:hypothetical protein
LTAANQQHNTDQLEADIFLFAAQDRAVRAMANSRVLLITGATTEI